jgi:predicted aconitase
VPDAVIELTPGDVRDVLARLSRAPEGAPLAALCLGTPHFSLEEWRRFAPLLRAAAPARGLPIYVNTGRATLDAARAEGLLDGLEAHGLVPVADTCTYVTAILREIDGVVMTNSGKWAQYAPGNIGVEVAFGEIEDCVASAVAGRVVRA